MVELNAICLVVQLIACLMHHRLGFDVARAIEHEQLVCMSLPINMSAALL
jgi:hypothetical protein